MYFNLRDKDRTQNFKVTNQTLCPPNHQKPEWVRHLVRNLEVVSSILHL